jgi:hypothetical protein
VYNFTYQGLETQIESAQFQNKINLWKEVQDFNWLKQEKSPNFTLIEE